MEWPDLKTNMQKNKPGSENMQTKHRSAGACQNLSSPSIPLNNCAEKSMPNVERTCTVARIVSAEAKLLPGTSS